MGSASGPLSYIVIHRHRRGRIRDVYCTISSARARGGSVDVRTRVRSIAIGTMANYSRSAHVRRTTMRTRTLASLL